MEGRRSNRKRKQASTSEGVKIVRRKKRNQAASASEGDKIVVTRKKRNQVASASEGGEILRRKKEMVAAIKAIAAEGMYGVKFTAEAAHEAGAGKMKRTKVVKTRVPQEFIDYMLTTPHPTVDPLSEEELATRSKEYREAYVKRKFKGDKIKAYYDALLDQYRILGYVDDEAEVDVTDDGEEN
ncbi:unnamed protein product [Urochloa humidicola]